MAVKIGLIADTHGNLEGWQQANEIVLGGADIIVHCGDVLYHGPKFSPVAGYDPAGLAEAINQTPVPVLIARGNADSDVDQLGCTLWICTYSPLSLKPGDVDQPSLR